MDNIKQHIEALIFSAEQGISIEEIMESLEKSFEGNAPTEDEVLKVIDSLTDRYKASNYSFGIVKSGGGYQFLTKSDYYTTINAYLNLKSKKRLSTAALETLSIIAYKQPITKTEIEAIRGVNCDYTIQKLLEKDMVEISGRKKAPGNPILYEVSQTFMDYFGITGTEELPQLKDIENNDDNTVGDPLPIENNPTETPSLSEETVPTNEEE